MTDINNPLLGLIAEGYKMQFDEKGTTHEAVLWASKADQYKRFETLLAPIISSLTSDPVSINDLGCGYGAFFTYLQNHPTLKCKQFYGYDICASFIEAANRTISDQRAQFHQSHKALFEADYSFASGTFNLIGPQPEEDWIEFVKGSLRLLFQSSKTAMVFNLLDQDVENKEEWLFYANAGDFYHFCCKALSSHTSLHPNPALKGFTLCVWK